MTMQEADRRRQRDLQTLDSGAAMDLVVVGGGATGLGIALDAALRGLRVALIEQGDFSQGTSSRSTKLVHGGVRYLAQGNFRLVYEALSERANLLANAPHIVQPLRFVMPAFKAWQLPFYGAGLLAYDRLAGRAGIGGTRFMGPAGVREQLPTVRTSGLLGGVTYWDGQFDDARLAITLARTARKQGALLLNHCSVNAVLSDGKRVAGVCARDSETGRSFTLHSSCVINATGVWVDQFRRPGRSTGELERPLVSPSQGVHLSFDRSLLPTDTALFWPRTSDGRVLFAIPWLGKIIVGTTDTGREDVPQEPRPLPGEVNYLLSECAEFLAAKPRRQDILSAWVGLRPLVNPGTADDGGPARPTQSISREHTVALRPDGLVTVTGGKWTTYRSMAQDAIDQCLAAGLLPATGPCITHRYALLGAEEGTNGRLTGASGLHSYGSEAEYVASLPGAERLIAPGLSEAMVRFAVRHEFARTVEDVLARRNRLLFLDARAAAKAADVVAGVMTSETGAAVQTEAFRALAARYIATPY